MRLFFIFLLLGLPLWADEVRVQDITVKVEQEKNKQGKQEFWVHASARYFYQSKQIWDVLKKYENLKYLVPRVKKSLVLQEDKGKAQVYLSINTPWPFAKLWTVVEVKQNPLQHHFEWVQVRGNLKEFQGWASIKENLGQNQGSRFESKMILRMGQGIPQFMQKWVIKYYIPKVLRELATKFEPPQKTPLLVEQKRVK